MIYKGDKLDKLEDNPEESTEWTIPFCVDCRHYAPPLLDGSVIGVGWGKHRCTNYSYVGVDLITGTTQVLTTLDAYEERTSKIPGKCGIVGRWFSKGD